MELCRSPLLTPPLSIFYQGLQNFGLTGILATYMRGLESEGVEWGAELRELRFQAAWRNTQWDCELAERCGHAVDGAVQSSIRRSLFLQLCRAFTGVKTPNQVSMSPCFVLCKR